MTDISTNIGTQYNILAGTGRHMEVSRLVNPLSQGQTEDLVPGCMMMASVISSPVALSAWDGDRDHAILGVLLEAVTTGASAVSARILARGSVKNAQCHVYDAGGNLQLTPVQWDHARKCGIVPVGNEYRALGGLGGVVSDNGTPPNLLAGASIIVYTTDPGDPEYGPELSGANGVYAFTGIRVGTYNVKATLAGHDDEIIEGVVIAYNTNTDLDITMDVTT